MSSDNRIIFRVVEVFFILLCCSFSIFLFSLFITRFFGAKCVFNYGSFQLDKGMKLPEFYLSFNIRDFIKSLHKTPVTKNMVSLYTNSTCDSVLEISPNLIIRLF